MRILEIPQSPGLWSLPLLPNTPKYLVDEIIRYLARYGRIAGEPGFPVAWYANQSGLVAAFTAQGDSDELSDARYTGRIMGLRWDGRRYTLYGEGLESFLQSNANIGGHWGDLDAGTVTNPDTKQIFTFDGVLSDFLPELKARMGSPGPPLNLDSYALGGLTPGVYHGGGFDPQFELEWWPGIGEREVIDWACSLAPDSDDLVAEWRVNPDGTIDWGYNQHLYRQNEVVVLPDPTVSFDSVRTAIAGRAGTSLDLSSTAVAGVGYGQGEGVSVDYEFRGTVLGNQFTFDGRESYKIRPPTAAMWPQVIADDPGLDGDPADLALRAGTRAAEVAQPVTVQSSDPTAPDRINGGDRVFYFDQPAWANDPDNPVTYAGQSIYPRSLRVHLMDWTASDRYAIRFFPARNYTTGEWVTPIDLSPFVDYQPPITTLTLGTGQGHAAAVTVRSPDRLSNLVDPGTQLPGGSGPGGIYAGDPSGPLNPDGPIPPLRDPVPPGFEDRFPQPQTGGF